MIQLWHPTNQSMVDFDGLKQSRHPDFTARPPPHSSFSERPSGRLAQLRRQNGGG
jgi:hypothetical protein